MKKYYLIFSLTFLTVSNFALEAKFINLSLPENESWFVSNAYNSLKGESVTLSLKGSQDGQISTLQLSSFPSNSIEEYSKDLRERFSSNKTINVTKFADVSDGEIFFQIKVEDTSPATLIIGRAMFDLDHVYQVIYSSNFENPEADKWIAILNKAEIDIRPIGSIYSIQFMNIEQNLSSFKAKFMLLKQSQAIDDRPVWSSDNKFLYYNEMGKWYKLNLEQIYCKEGKLRGNNIAVGSYTNFELVNYSEMKAHLASNIFGRREVKINKNNFIKLKQQDLGTEFVTRINGKTKTWWRSDFENNHSIALSPNFRYVAFIAEQNGIILFKIAE